MILTIGKARKKKESEACYENIYTPQQLSSYIWNLHQQSNPDFKYQCYLRKRLQERGLYPGPPHPKYGFDSNGGTQTSEEELFETGSVIAIDSNGGTQTSEVEGFNGGTQTTQEEEWQDDASVINFSKQRLEQNNTINSNEDESDGNLSTDIHEVKETEDISEKASPTKDKTKNDALFAETKKKAATIIIRVIAATIIIRFIKKNKERLHVLKARRLIKKHQDFAKAVYEREKAAAKPGEEKSLGRHPLKNI